MCIRDRAGTDQLQKLNQSIFEENQVKVWIGEESKLELPELLKEVDR